MATVGENPQLYAVAYRIRYGGGTLFGREAKIAGRQIKIFGDRRLCALSRGFED